MLILISIGRTYLDHAGSQLPSISAIDGYFNDLKTSLYGNPHSAEGHDATDFAKLPPSFLAGHRIDTIRNRTLEFFGANPEDFDLVFVHNATAAIRLVGECFHDYAAANSKSSRFRSKNTSFWYGYHRDCHNSMVGVRELTNGNHRCFVDDAEVDAWIDSKEGPSANQVALFGYPGKKHCYLIKSGL
jgi:molybdenum cofactor sulfurtransferase